MLKLLLAAVAGAALAVGSGASAAPLQYNVLLNGVSISGVQTAASGFVPTFSYSSGGFTVSGSAFGDPFLTSPNFSTSSTSVKSNGNSGTVTVLFTDYNLPSYTGNIASTLNLNALLGSSLASATVTNYFSQSNTPFATTTSLATLSTGAGGNPSLNQTVGTFENGPFSETTVYTFVFNSAGNGNTVTGSSQIAAVPEPASLAVVGAGLTAIGFMRRRRSA